MSQNKNQDYQPGCDVEDGMLPYSRHNTKKQKAFTTMATAAAAAQALPSIAPAALGGMDELLPLVKQLTDPDQVRRLFIHSFIAKANES